MDEQGRHLIVAFHLLAATTLGGCASLSSDAPVQARAAAYAACPPAGLWTDIDLGPGWSTPDGSMGVGPITTRFLFPDSPEWRPRPPVPDEILLDPATWRRPPSETNRHRALRSRLGYQRPSGTTQVLILERSEHYTKVESSTIATRHQGGIWAVDRAREWNIGSGFEESRIETWRLSDDDARRLENLLADRCLEAEPLNADYAEIGSSTGNRWTLEIVQPGSRLVFGRWHGGFGRVGEIYHLITHREPLP